MEAKFPIEEGRCPMCNSSEVASDGDARRGDQIVEMYQCVSCGLVFQEWYKTKFTGMTTYGPDEDHIDITSPEDDFYLVVAKHLKIVPDNTAKLSTWVHNIVKLHILKLQYDVEMQEKITASLLADAENTSTEELGVANDILERALNEPTSTVGLNYIDRHYTINLADDGTMDTVIEIGGREFRFDGEHASGYRTEDGAMTTQGLVDLGTEALTDLEGSELEKLANEKKDTKITKAEVESRYPNVIIDKLPDDEWNLLDQAMFRGDWDTIGTIMQPRQDLSEKEKS